MDEDRTRCTWPVAKSLRRRPLPRPQRRPHYVNLPKARQVTWPSVDDGNQRPGLTPTIAVGSTLDLAHRRSRLQSGLQLPVRGQPSLYPFDQYRLWLGVGGIATQADGTTVEITRKHWAVMPSSVQDRIPDMIMDAPETVPRRRCAPPPIRMASWWCSH